MLKFLLNYLSILFKESSEKAPLSGCYVGCKVMIWVVEKLIVHHFIDMGFEMLKIPIKVEVEYGLEGSTVTSLSKKTLYNLPYLVKQYPKLNQDKLKAAIEQTVKKKLSDHFKIKGYTYRSQ